MKVIENIHYETFEELKEALTGTDYSISKKIINNVERNINSKKKIKILECTAADMDIAFDLELAPEDFITCLESNLLIFEGVEDFDGCIRISEMIEYLKSK